MKKILILLMTFISVNTLAGEVTGAGKVVDSILHKNGFTKEKLKIAGLQLKLGEVTGAGRIHIDDLSHIITKKNVLNLNDVQHVEFVHPSQGKFTGEVKSFVFPTKSVAQKKILAYIHKRN